MILFLDFDGTLHPEWVFHEGPERVTALPYTGPWLIEAPTLERILAPYIDQIEIVISSWWAYTKGMDTVLGMLPRAIAERVTESIWLRELEIDYQSDLCTRYGCIRAWLDRRRPDYVGEWLALDDDCNGWPDEERHRLIQARGTLANPKVQNELAAKLADLCRPWNQNSPLSF